MFVWCFLTLCMGQNDAGTHYQFLWYVARVFLPGKLELCRLSALLRPAQYADILSQKVSAIFICYRYLLS